MSENVIPGIISALTTILIGYPFDTIKSKLQINRYGSTNICVKDTYRNGGIKNFYRGVQLPLSLLTIKRAYQYPIYEYLQSEKKMSPWFAGGIAGLSGSLIGCPMHVVKLSMQTFPKEKYPSVYSCVKNIIKKDSWRGLYRGFRVNLVKDVCFSTLYLGTYGTMRKNLPDSEFSYFFAGGISSIITWTILFPLDTIRVNIQRDVPWSNIRKLINKPIKLWSGILPTILRVFPISAFGMLSYEFSRKILN